MGGIEVDVLEEVLPHEAVIAVQAVAGHRVVLVEIEGDDPGEVEALFAMQANQLAVDPDRCGAGGQSQHRELPCAVSIANDLGHAARDPPSNVVVLVGDDGWDPLGSLGRSGSRGRSHGSVRGGGIDARQAKRGAEILSERRSFLDTRARDQKI